MRTPNCSVCGRQGDPAGGRCPHCGNVLPVAQKIPSPPRTREKDGESDFGKYLAVGVFAGALIAASLILFLIFSSGGPKKGGDLAPAEQTLIQSPAQTVPSTSATPQDDAADDKKPASVPARRGLKKAPQTHDDSKRKRQDIIETPGKNPKMTQY